MSTVTKFRLGSKMGRLDGGLNIADPARLLDASQASDLENVWFHNGALRKRPGIVSDGDLGIGAPVDSSYLDESNSRLLLQAASALYSYDLTSDTLTRFYTLLIPAGASSAPAGTFFTYDDGCVYFINGTEYIRWNGVSVENVPARAPVYQVYSTSSLTAPAIESHPLNLLSEYVTLEYRLNESTISSLAIPPEIDRNVQATVYYNGTSLGKKSFNSNRLTLGSNYNALSCVFLVVAKLLPAYRPDPSGLRACRRCVNYGPESRVFLCGNGSNQLYCSAAFDPTYFPADSVTSFGPGEELTGFGQLYGSLIVFRPHGIAEVEFTSDSFVLRTINPVIGCDIPGSVRTIGNRLVWANSSEGVHMLVSTSREYERNVQNLSRNIDPLLLAESSASLAAASSFDFDGCYWLCVGSHVYVWDYENRPYTSTGGAFACAWYYFTGIPASFFWTDGGSLCFCDRISDYIYRFSSDFTDLDLPFRASYRTGMIDAGCPMCAKNLKELRVTSHIASPQNYTATVRCDELDLNTALTIPQGLSCSADPDSFTHTFIRPLRRRSVLYFSLEFTCTSRIASMDIADAEITLQARKCPR